jgi:putative tryptophan/tyrosine transport system substrate-binding protein
MVMAKAKTKLLQRVKAAEGNMPRATFSVEEVGRILGISRAAAYTFARSGQLPAIRLSSLHREIITLAAEYGLPAIYQWKEHVEAGGLVSYGPNLAAMWRQSAVIIAKVLKGAKPADVPVEQPTKLELVVNFRTAKSLDLTIPPSVLLRADEVIE